MFTDLVGFTSLGQRNEGEALRLRREHQEIVRPLLAAHGGREVKTTGDGFLVEFPSAVESVRCAVEIQGAVGRRNALAGSAEPIRLRIGIHVGDVVDDAGDIVGDAVNVASRIEPLAEPGGVCVSGSVYDQVRNKLEVPLERVGTRELKHVEFPVDIYRVRLGETFEPRERVVEPGPDARPRLAVLPMANLSPDTADDYFADGLTEELISQTSRIPDLRVIARTSVLQYKGSTKPLRTVAHELGVGLALEGSVRKSGDRLRVTVQLVDARSEEHLWSSRYDRPLGDIFAIQDDIAQQVATSMAAHMTGRGAAPGRRVLPAVRDTTDLRAYTAYLHGRKLLSEKDSETTVARAVELFEEAERIDPNFARARVARAEALMWLMNEGAVPLLDGEKEVRTELARAIELDASLAEAHAAFAGLLLGTDELAASERESRRAMELNPNVIDSYRWLAQIAAGDGRLDEAARLLETAVQIDPLDINILAFLGRIYFYAGHIDRALEHWKRTETLVPYRTQAHRAEYALSIGDLDAAQTYVRDLERLRPESVWTEVYRGALAARRGRPEETRAAIERLERRGQTGEMTALFTGALYHALGEDDAFVRCMEEAFDQHSLPFLELLYSPLYERARADPRIRALIERQRALRTAEGDTPPRRTP